MTFASRAAAALEAALSHLLAATLVALVVMDATFVLTNSNWVMAELVRVYHDLSTKEAQELVDSLVERRIPLIWESVNVRRVLDPTMKLKPQILVLLATPSKTIETSELIEWTGYENRSYFLKLLREMHSERLIELSKDERQVQILPPGNKLAADVVRSARV